MSEHKLAAPRCRVLVEQEDGQLAEFTVQTDNRDAIRYDLLRERKGWPGMKDAPMLWMSVLCWHAIKRSGGTSDDVEKYLDRIVEVQPITEDGDPADPTDPDALAAAPLA